MFSKTIFKQTLKSNWKLWAVFTGIMAVMSALVIAVFDRKMISSMMNMVKNMPGIADIIGDRMDSMTSVLGLLGQSFYSLQGIILGLIFVIMTANSLVASQVDKGSMAYLLSTPIKRSKVVRTQALYLISSVLCMFLIVTSVGLVTVQVAHHGLWAEEYTADVKAAAQVLDLSDETVAGDLTLILADDDAVTSGAEARGIDKDVYTTYLGLKMAENAGVEQPGIPADQMEKIQASFMAGITAAAEVLDVDASDLATDMGKIKNSDAAMTAAVDASGLPKELFVTIVNGQLANDELTLDQGIEFSVKDYLLLNLGAFLLLFALSSISFLFSCVFNLSKNSLMLGAGIPIAFFLFQIMSQVGSSLEDFKYVSLNTLFAPGDITGGGTFWPQFAVLAALGVVLYTVGVEVFKEKDLPL
ncbi:MAG: ABC-2 transporter permease [Propionibacteriaceae bacterium]|jgi:ABC-2 type transport system permease protein|nr:ABC-2 transporter permease [Propionibacteriaceae bacterium]